MNSKLDPMGDNSGDLPLAMPLLMIFLVVIVGYGIAPTRLPLVGEETTRALHGIEMVRSGDWLIATLQGIPILDRPPAQYWTLALIHKWIHSLDTLTLRLSMLLITLSTALVIFGYASRFLDRTGAFIAAVAYPTFGHVFDLGRRVETDGLFTLLLASALLYWHYGYSRSLSPYRIWLPAVTLAALATLTKGLQAPVAFFGAIYFFLLVQRDRKRLLSGAHMIGLALFLLLIAVWQVPFYFEAGWEGTRSTWLDPGGKRMTFEVPGLLPHLALFPLEVFGACMPWSLLLVGLVFREFWELGGEERSCLLFVVLSIAMIFVPVWINAGGSARYTMPLYPFVAIVSGMAVQRSLAVGPDRPLGFLWWGYSRFMVLMVAAFLLFYSGVTVVSWSTESPFAQMLRQPGWLMALLLLSNALGFVFVFIWRPPEPRRHATGAGFVVAVLVAGCFNGPILNTQAYRAANVGPEITALYENLSPDKELVSFGPLHHKFIYWYGYAEPIPILPWPHTAADVPDDLEYFGIHVKRKRQAPELPFLWEPVARFNMDKRKTAKPHDSVWIGRRVLPKNAGRPFCR